MVSTDDLSRCLRYGAHVLQGFGESWQGKAIDQHRLALCWRDSDELEVVSEEATMKLCCSKVLASCVNWHPGLRPLMLKVHQTLESPAVQRREHRRAELVL